MSGAAERRLALALAVLARWSGAVDGRAVVATAAVIDDWIGGGAAPPPVVAAEPEPDAAAAETAAEPEPDAAAETTAESEPDAAAETAAEPEPDAAAETTAEPEPDAAAEKRDIKGSIFDVMRDAVTHGAPPPSNLELAEKFGVSYAGVSKALQRLRQEKNIAVEPAGPKRRVAVEINGAWRWSPWSKCEAPSAQTISRLDDPPPHHPLAKKEFLSLHDAAEAAAAFLRTRDFEVTRKDDYWVIDNRKIDHLSLLATANRHLRQMKRPIYVVRGGCVAA